MIGRNPLVKALAVASDISRNPNDTEELQLQKTLMLALALSLVPITAFWGVIYLIFNEPLAAAIPLTYSLISAISVVIFSRIQNYEFFRFSQLLFLLFLPFSLMVVLGGFVNASAVILWSIISPISALVFPGTRHARRWLLAYLGLVVVSGFLQTVVRPTNNLPPLLINIFFVMNITTVSSITFATLYYFISQRDQAHTLLQAEQQKSERLLLNVLPKEIALILKDEDRTVAQHFDSASILFADLVGFTSLSLQMTPEEMVNLLNEIFSHFDSLVDKFDLEKIRTVGDGYMVAAGVPSPRPDHCQTIARLALEMSAYMNNPPPFSGQPIAFRMGIDTGPMIGGVIGHTKFHYDVWGDTVNTASRMESHGVPQKIQVTQTVAEILKDEFVCETRGRIEIKGKGEMEVWFLIGEKEPQTLIYPDV